MVFTLFGCKISKVAGDQNAIGRFGFITIFTSGFFISLSSKCFTKTYAHIDAFVYMYQGLMKCLCLIHIRPQ